MGINRGHRINASTQSTTLMTEINQEEQVLISLRQIIRATDIYSRQLSKEVGLTAPQLLILQAIRGLGAVSISKLSEEISLSQATVTNIIDRLESRGIVARHRSTQDRRVVHTTLTEEGTTKVLDAPTPIQDTFSKRFAAYDFASSRFDRFNARFSFKELFALVLLPWLLLSWPFAMNPRLSFVR